MQNRDNSIHIKEVLTVRERLLFIKFAEQLYKGADNFVPPLRRDELDRLDPKTNPAFSYCSATLFMAIKENRVCGRIALIENRKSNLIWGEKRVRFGWFDFEDNLEISQALLNRAEEWAKERGAQIVSGPHGFNDIDAQGLLTEGFQNSSTTFTLYNFDYYARHLEAAGYRKEAEWSQRRLVVPREIPKKLESFSSIVLERYNLTIAQVSNRKERLKLGREMFEAYNESFKDLYCFNPLNKDEIEKAVNQFAGIVNPHFTCIIKDNSGQVVAFAITIPSLSHAFKRASGRVFPFGFIHIYRALRRYKKIEMLMIGVKEEYRNKGLNAVIFTSINRSCLKYGVEELITYPQLEDNHAVKRLFDYYPMYPYMKRACYCKDLITVSLSEL